MRKKKSNVSENLQKIQDYYDDHKSCDTSYDGKWYSTGIRKIDDLVIADDDWEIEAHFIIKGIVRGVNKSVYMEDDVMHTRLLSMTLKTDDGKSELFQKEDLLKMYCNANGSDVEQEEEEEVDDND